MRTSSSEKQKLNMGIDISNVEHQNSSKDLKTL